MLKNLPYELKKKKITQTQIAQFLGLSRRSLNLKISEQCEFKRDEMIKIRDEYFPDKTLDELFSE